MNFHILKDFLFIEYLKYLKTLLIVYNKKGKIPLDQILHF
jgi:hypothetical protein